MERRIETLAPTSKSPISVKPLPKNPPKAHSTDLSDASLQHLGRVVGFFGLKGAMKIAPATNNPSLFLNVKEVTFRLAGHQEKRAAVSNARLKKQLIQLQLTDYPTRTSVEHLLNAQVLVEASQIAALPENEWWLKDLIGMKVFTTEGSFIGTVCDALGKDGQFLEIRKAGAEESDTILVPFVRQLVPVVDTRAGKIEVVNLPGLLD